MYAVAVVNGKGGCGKSTIATHLAARFARLGHRPLLVDLDRQRSAWAWAQRRAEGLPALDAAAGDVDALELPRAHPFVVVDAPAGLRRRGLEALIGAVDAVIVPVVPGAFDEDATTRLLERVAEIKAVRKGRVPVALVANRVQRGAAGQRLAAFLAGAPFPCVATLAESQHYVAAAAQGRTVFDLPLARVGRPLEDWRPLLAWLDAAVLAAPTGTGA